MATEKPSILPGGQIMSSSTSTSVDDIDDALLVEILVRGLLTSKIAFQCKVVCKRWQSLISSPMFVRLWKELHYWEPLPLTLVINLRIRRGEDKYIINYVVSKPRLLPFLRLRLDFLPCSRPRKATSVRIAASSNDLFLCHSIGHKMDMEPRVYYICNPVTKNWVAIPPFPSKYPFMKCAVGMVCGDESFQVVRIHGGSSSSSFIAEVFSSETNTWEEMEVTTHPFNLKFSFDFMFSHRSYSSDNMFCWNGILFLENKWGRNIIAYNPLEPESCHVLNTPTDPLGRYIDSMAFSECRGSFQLLQHCDFDRLIIGGGRGFFRIWELKDYQQGEWSFKNEIFFRELITDDAFLQHEIYYDQGPCLQVLALDSIDGDTIYFYHDSRNSGGRSRRIFSCNLRTKEVKLFDSTIHQRSADDFLCLRNVFQFVAPKWPTAVPVLP